MGWNSHFIRGMVLFIFLAIAGYLVSFKTEGIIKPKPLFFMPAIYKPHINSSKIQGTEMTNCRE